MLFVLAILSLLFLAAVAPGAALITALIAANILAIRLLCRASPATGTLG